VVQKAVETSLNYRTQRSW